MDVRLASKFTDARGERCPKCSMSGKNLGRLDEKLFFCLDCGSVFVSRKYLRQMRDNMPQLLKEQTQRVKQGLLDAVREGHTLDVLIKRIGGTEPYTRSLLAEMGYDKVCSKCRLPCRGNVGLSAHIRSKHEPEKAPEVPSEPKAEPHTWEDQHESQY